jgi:hypothetical protein
MNRPASITRVLGSPRVAAALYVGCAVAVLGWLGGGGVPWWLALASLCCVGTVRKAVKDVRRYEQWSGAWDAMGPGSASPAAASKPIMRKRKPSSRWHGVIGAALLLFPIIPFLAVSAAGEAMRNGLTLLWLATAVYLVCKVALNLRPARTSSVKAAPASPAAPMKANAADIVQWLLPRASSSPSRADALRQLPEHCARLMS